MAEGGGRRFRRFLYSCCVRERGSFAVASASFVASRLGVASGRFSLGPLLFEDLDVYFSQEECVSLHPAQKTNSREAPLEYFEDLDLIGGEDKTETSQQLSPESMELEELSLETYSIAAPLVHYSEKSEDAAEIHERKMSGGTFTCKTKVINLLVTIENQTPLVELSQCLGVRTLSDIIEVPWEEPKNVYKCPDCDQSFSPSDTLYQHTHCVENLEQPSYPALPEKDHKEDSKNFSIDDEDFFSFSRFKPLQCLDCDMTFPCFSELVSHQTVHDMEKPHKCKTCAKTFALDSELASHEKTHIKEPFKCTVCGKSFRVNMHLITHKRTHRRNTK
ncbi:zinc finger protein 597 [Sigmodon hispidus]